jgi:hypothetical protein
MGAQLAITKHDFACFFCFLLLHAADTIRPAWTGFGIHTYRKLIKYRAQHPILAMTV